MAGGLLLAVLALQAALPVPPLPFEARTTLAPREARIGERIVLTIAIDAPPGIEQVRPRVEPQLGDFEVLAIDSTAVRTGPGGWTQTWRITLLTFEAGTRDLPPVPLEYAAAGGRLFAGSVLHRPGVLIRAPAVTAESPLRGLAPRADVPPPSPWPRVLPIAAVVALAVTAVVVPTARWWSRRLARARRAAFFAALHAELARLAASPCADPRDARERYARAAALVRQGMTGLLPGRLDALTSTDLAARVAATGAPAGLSQRVRVAMSAVDAVKFGNFTPAGPQHAAVLGEAQGLLRDVASRC